MALNEQDLALPPHVDDLAQVLDDFKTAEIDPLPHIWLWAGVKEPAYTRYANAFRQVKKAMTDILTLY